MGLSYSQTRRILQGYSSRGKVYAGLLEKCPAVRMVDATMVDDSTEVVIRRHELIFQFDAGRYREWKGGLTVWLDDDDDGDSGCNQGCKEIRGCENQRSEPESENEGSFERIRNCDPGSYAPPGTVGARNSADNATRNRALGTVRTTPLEQQGLWEQCDNATRSSGSAGNSAHAEP